jgi:hypothetical protein
MDERMTRLWAASEAEAIGRGGIAIVSRATGIARSTIGIGARELRDGVDADRIVKVRRKGGGRRPHEEVHPDLVPALLKLVAPATRGDPESSLRWTSKSTHVLSAEMFDTYGIRVGDKTIARLLRDNDYSLQATHKTVEGKQHPDRDAQFKNISEKADDCVKRGVPFVSVDTKKKELVGNFKNAGVEWQPEDSPELVDVHDFPTQAIGKAIPYGVFDVADNSGFVNVGTDHDTPVFAVASIEAWWKLVGQKRYSGAKELFITADAGGSNGHRPRVWKVELQRLADKLGMSIHVSHLGPRHQQVEQDRTSPPLLVHHVELARSTTANLQDRREPHRQHDHARRARRPCQARQTTLSDRQENLAEGNAHAQHREGRLPWGLELHHPPTGARPVSNRVILTRALSDASASASMAWAANASPYRSTAMRMKSSAARARSDIRTGISQSNSSSFSTSSDGTSTGPAPVSRPCMSCDNDGAAAAMNGMAHP